MRVTASRRSRYRQDNFNNRTEEAIGNAEDMWTAYREGRFGRHPAPMLGYFFLLEDSPRVHAPVKNSESYFKVDPLFSNSSYARRYAVPDACYQGESNESVVS
jgi:hypothetical protein